MSMTPDYEAALTSAVTFVRTIDITAVEGPEAGSFLNNLSTADAVKLPVDHAVDAWFCDHRGKALFQTLLVRTAPESFELLSEAGFGSVLQAHLDRYLISENATLTGDTRPLAYTAGPTAHDEAGLSLDDYRYQDGVLRRDWLGLPGYLRFESSLPMNAASDEAYETLRIEAGTPVYGKDIDANRFVMEVAGALNSVCYTKGCFLGQEPIVMSRDRAGGPSRLFVGVRSEAPLGAKLFKDGAEVGVTTSRCWSPRLNAHLTLAYLRRGHHTRGTGVVDEAGVTATVLGHPPLSNDNTI